jgi:aminomethyltransferase
MAETEILKTPLHSLHLELGARMTPFAGYDMPLQYPPGILKEHLHTRAKAGLFDVSHMGQLALRPKSGNIADAALALERLVPMDILGLANGRQRYALFTNAAGGILDDLMATNRGDHLFLVVNAACKVADEAHLRAHLSDACEIERLGDRALLALQGPEAGAVLAAMAPESAGMRFMDVRALPLAGHDCIVSRSGYTGEDGFEISVTNAAAVDLARALLDHEAVAPIGLGARDSLRLEAGLCLYGSDIDTTTSPVEASLVWAMQKTRHPGGARAGGFPGAERILAELADGPGRRRVGLLPEGRAPVRAHAPLFAAEDDTDPVGTVTSGAFGPSLGGPMAMGYVPADLAATGTRLFAEVRGRKLPVAVADMPFVKPNYKRG